MNTRYIHRNNYSRLEKYVKIRTNIRVRSDKMTVRFFHTADLHLDSPFKGSYHLPHQVVQQLRESTFQAFEALVTYAVQEKPDFLLIVGDLYDGENRSLTAQYKFIQQLERLNEADIPVFMSYGNHDHLSGTWSRLPLPKNVQEFSKDVSSKLILVRGQEVVVHGFSYEKRHISEPKIEDYPIKNDDAIHIGTLHGSVDTDLDHAVYAPFTVQQLLKKQYDYWALGHIHKHQVLNEQPPIIYSGNIQGRHKNEQGEKGFYDVTIAPDGTTFTFQKTSVIRYESIELDCSQVEDAMALLKAIDHKFESIRGQLGAAMVELTLVNCTAEFIQYFHETSSQEWESIIREQQSTFEPFIWLSKIQIKQQTMRLEGHELMKSIVEKIEAFDSQQLKNITADLIQQPKYMQLIEPMNEQLWQELKDEANLQLQRLLMGMVK